MEDCAGPASREVLLGHLSCPHSPDLARIQATLVVAHNNSADAVFGKLGGRLDGVFLPDRSALHGRLVSCPGDVFSDDATLGISVRPTKRASAL